MRKLLTAFLILASLVLCTWWLARPRPLTELDSAPRAADAARGELVFYAAGCGSCHAAESQSPEDPPELSGGRVLKTPAGRFLVPNITPDHATGIGGWSLTDFANALWRGISPAGRHYYPSFPYTSYARMSLQDLADLKAWLDSRPAVRHRVGAHDLAWPFRARWAIGLWKRLYLDPSPIVSVDESDSAQVRGRYLVEALGHCGECHTPRDRLLAMRRSQWLAGAPSADGEGRVPDITPQAKGLADWSPEDITYFLKTGIDPDFDVVGGAMAEVQENLARLSDADRQAIAAYLAVVPPRP